MPAFPKLASAAAAALGVASLAHAASYSLIESNKGATFFNNFDFYDNYTNGDVQYVPSSYTPPLAYVNDAQNAILKVSTETVIYDNKRNSVRITQKSKHDVGTVFVFDAIHLPFGCSVWPAFWTRSPEWPVGGEIDILEGVNRQLKNQMALHTVEGCTLTSTPDLTGTLGQTNCNATGNSGCVIYEESDKSYGDGFNTNGGGVWVTELAEEGVKIWFFSRADVPSSISANASSIDTSSLGTPSGFWSASGCSPISDYIHSQQVVLNIALCGDWAGVASVLESTGCTAPVAPETCYTTYVLNGNEDFDNAFMEIQYLNVYSSSSSASSVSNNPTSTLNRSANPSATGANTAAASESGTSGASARTGGAWVGAGALGALGLWALI